MLSYPSVDSNPYLNMLYLPARMNGVEVRELAEFDDLLVALPSLGEGAVFHLHWTSSIAQAAKSLSGAYERLRLFQGAWAAARSNGAKLIFTLHNVFPHHTPHPAAEVELMQWLMATADRVHVMSEQAASVVAPHYEIPAEKSVLIPHASYAGLYERGVERRTNRRESLGIDDDTLAILFFGQLRPYKGVDRLLSALPTVAERRRIVALLAGKTAPHELPRFETLLPPEVRIIRKNTFVAEELVADWFAPADVMVLPYRSILNSGSMMLSATFGVPVLLPREPHLVEQYGNQPWVGFFEADVPGALSEALATFDARSESMRASARAFADAYTPMQMGTDYARLLADLR